MKIPWNGVQIHSKINYLYIIGMDISLVELSRARSNVVMDS